MAPRSHRESEVHPVDDQGKDRERGARHAVGGGAQDFLDIEIHEETELEVKLLPRSVDPNPQRVGTTKAVVEKFGGSEGRFGSITAMPGGKGVSRHERCRERTEATEKE